MNPADLPDPTGTAPWIDAHNHLHDPHLDPVREEWLAHLPGPSVVNGTCEADWEAVAKLADRFPQVIPCFGMHPWKIDSRSDTWEARLRDYLGRFPRAGIGEMGLDRWMPNPDIPAQRELFEKQLQLATEENRLLTIHCLQAWGLLLELLQKNPRPARGFLLHAYGGPEEMVTGFVELGAYFSFSTYYLHPRKTKQRATFGMIPLERLLVETDAPSMAPPSERARAIIPGAEDQNHPANLLAAYEELASVRRLQLSDLKAQIAQNFAAWRTGP